MSCAALSLSCAALSRSRLGRGAAALGLGAVCCGIWASVHLGIGAWLLSMRASLLWAVFGGVILSLSLGWRGLEVSVRVVHCISV
jgi:hypothetical protein